MEFNQRKALTTPKKIDYLADKQWLKEVKIDKSRVNSKSNLRASSRSPENIEDTSQLARRKATQYLQDQRNKRNAGH